MIDEITSAAYALGWAGVRRMPESAARRLFMRGADLAFRRQGPGTRRLAANYRRVRPDLDDAAHAELVHAGLRSYARYWMEAFRLPSIGPDRILGETRFTPLERYTDAVAKGGIVIALPHMGNWDAAGAWAAMRGDHLVSVAERLKPESLYEQFLDFRRTLGMEILGHGTPRIIDALVERARAGAVVALVADRDLSRRGIEVEFFGERTRMPAGPALVALGAGVPLFPATLTLDDDWGWSIQLHEAVVAPPDAADPVAAMVQGTARAFEQGIREKPQDWHMLQPLWLADLDPRRAPAAGSGNATAGDTQGSTGGGADDAEGKGSRG